MDAVCEDCTYASASKKRPGAAAEVQQRSPRATRPPDAPGTPDGTFGKGDECERDTGEGAGASGGNGNGKGNGEGREGVGEGKGEGKEGSTGVGTGVGEGKEG